MLDMLKFLVTNNITGVALMRYFLITYLIHIIKVSQAIKYDYCINSNESTPEAIDLEVKSKLAHTLNFVYFVSQILRVI